MKKLIVLCIVLAIMSGCTLRKRVNTLPCTGSTIMNVLDNAAEIGTLIEVSNYIAISKNQYSKEQAVAALNIVKDFLHEDGITFGQLIQLTKPMLSALSLNSGTEMSDNLNMASNVLIISSVFTNMELEWLINACDREILIGLCNRLLTQCE